ncbi:hypothetical protein ACFX15_021096 [Malus domestica]
MPNRLHCYRDLLEAVDLFRLKLIFGIGICRRRGCNTIIEFISTSELSSDPQMFLMLEPCFQINVAT